MKRKDYISWDEYFMGVAILASKRSKDPNTQVGACIVDNNNIILSTGYNGFPIGFAEMVKTQSTVLWYSPSLMLYLMQEAKILRAQGCTLTFSLATNVQKPLFSRVYLSSFIFI